MLIEEISYSASVGKSTPFPQHKSTVPMRSQNTTDDSFFKMLKLIFVHKEIKCRLLFRIPHCKLPFWRPLSGNVSQPLRFCYIHLTCNKNTGKLFKVSLRFGHWSASLLPYFAIIWISWGIPIQMFFISGQFPLQMYPQPLSPIFLFQSWVLKYVHRPIFCKFHSAFEK